MILQSDKPACLGLSTLMKLEERDYIKLIIKEFAQEKTETKEIPEANDYMKVNLESLADFIYVILHLNITLIFDGKKIYMYKARCNKQAFSCT